MPRHGPMAVAILTFTVIAACSGDGSPPGPTIDGGEVTEIPEQYLP